MPYLRKSNCSERVFTRKTEEEDNPQKLGEEDDETLFVGTIQKYSLVIDSYLVRQPEFFYNSDIGQNLSEKEEDTSGRKLWSRTVTDEKGEEEKKRG